MYNSGIQAGEEGASPQQAPMAFGEVGPQPWQECRLVRATSGACQVQQVSHEEQHQLRKQKGSSTKHAGDISESTCLQLVVEMVGCVF